MAEEDELASRWAELKRCPKCGAEMQREAAVGERIGLYYRCSEHGRFRYSWDDDNLQPFAEGE